MEEFISLNSLEDDMRKWMPSLINFKEKHAFLSHQTILLNNSMNWVDLNKLRQDSFDLNLLFFHSMLVVKFLELRKTIEFLHARAESIKLSDNKCQISSNDKEFKEEVKDDFHAELEMKIEERKDKILLSEHESSHTQVYGFTNLFKYAFC